MNTEPKLLVQKSFETVLTIEEAAAALFYGRLFELDPSLRPLFKGDLKEQGKKLMATLKVCVLGLDRLDQLLPAVQSLGRRHVGYGVTDAHYDTVAAALLWTLEKGLGDQFTPECRAAWTEVYLLLASVMKEAAARGEVVPTRTAVSQRAVIPLSQRLPLSQRIPASRLPMSKRTPF
jgi:hemoglobin-like flavoprotein